MNTLLKEAPQVTRNRLREQGAASADGAAAAELAKLRAENEELLATLASTMKVVCE